MQSCKLLRGNLQMSMLKAFKQRFRSIRQRILWGRIETDQEDIRDILIEMRAEYMRTQDRNPISRMGRKCFSQGDEDGITLELIKRLEIQNGHFVELGVGDGTENNTLILKALGWSGIWISGQNILPIIPDTPASFIFDHKWISKSNIVSLLQENMHRSGTSHINFFSVDLDGNDIEYLEEVLSKSGFLPDIICVEYNAKFFPPVRWRMPYDESHVWKSDDYFGSSLMSYIDIMNNYGYFLVACNNQSGSNAFFVQKKYSEKFSDIPKEIMQIYKPPQYKFYSRYGHRKSIKTVESVISSIASFNNGRSGEH